MASSVIAVVDMAAKVAALCFQYSMEVKHAKQSINQLRNRVMELETVSAGLQKLLEGPNSSGLAVSQQLQGAIDSILSELRHVHEALRPKSAHQALSRLGIRSLKWPFESKAMDKIMQNLKQHTQTISLALEIDQTYVTRF